jgi:hypothetical protein
VAALAAAESRAVGPEFGRQVKAIGDAIAKAFQIAELRPHKTAVGLEETDSLIRTPCRSERGFGGESWYVHVALPPLRFPIRNYL